MQRLENFFHKTLIKNGVLNERILKLDYNCWRVSLEYLRDCTTVQKFFSYTKLVNYMYSTLYELHRDLFPSELIRVRGSMSAFLKTIYGFLFLTNEFNFDSGKLQNIKQRKRRYNLIKPLKVVPDNSVQSHNKVKHFTYSIKNVKTDEFSKVDCLSRLPSSEILPDDVEVLEVEDAMLNNVPLDLERIREAQVDDKIISIVSQLVLTTFPKYINPLPAEENL